MRKHGFTIVELLVALSVIAVIAAMLIPGLNRIIPDKDKGLILKAYNTVAEINNDIFHNPSLYALGTLIEGTTTDCEEILQCTSVPLDGQHASYKGIDKYPLLLADNLSLSDDIAKEEGSNVYNFVTSDGMRWTITAIVDESTNLLTSYTIVINTQTEEKQDCFFSADCKNPRQYCFVVDEKGRVNAADSLTRAYIMNPSNLNDRDADLEKAESLLS